MFFGCVGLRADLSGWRLGRHRHINLYGMLWNTEGAEVGSLEGWAEERRVAGVNVRLMLLSNRGSIATPRWARRAEDFNEIRGCRQDPWAGKGAEMM